MKKFIGVLCFCFALFIIQYAVAYPEPIRIGHGLIGDLNPHETGAIVLGYYFDPNQAFNDNGRCESKIFDHWRLMSYGFYWRPISL